MLLLTYHIMRNFSGKYTFLSLFIAVTLEAFDTQGEGPPPTGCPPDATKLPELKGPKSSSKW